MRKIIIATISIALLAVAGCKKDSNPAPAPDAGKLPVNPNLTSTSGDYFGKLEAQYGSLNESVYYVFKDWYLWNEELPTLNYGSFSTEESLLKALKNPKDKWSFIVDKAEGDAFFGSGNTQGKGLDLWYDLKEYYSNNNRILRVAYVYPNSPAALKGIYRGMQINKINGKNIVQSIDDNTIDDELSKSTVIYHLVDSTGNNVIDTVTDGSFQIKTVLHKEFITIGTKKVGYLVFNAFIGTAEDELKNAFVYFKTHGVTELILDLRYNGGGSIATSNLLASMIVGNAQKDKVFITEKFNKNYSYLNESLKFISTPNGLDLNRIFIIGSRFTASASELIINGLKPYISVYLIGETTHGKPVGFFPFTYKDKEIYPVSLESVNADGMGGYYDGIEPTVLKYDGIQYQFGDKREYCLKEAIHYLQNGYFTSSLARIEKDEQSLKFPEKTGLRQFSGAW